MFPLLVEEGVGGGGTRLFPAFDIRRGTDYNVLASPSPAVQGGTTQSPCRTWVRSTMPDHPLASQVLCLGILVADVFVPPLPALPAAGELRATDDFLLDTGGCAANVATCLARLGIRAAVLGRVGN